MANLNGIFESANVQKRETLPTEKIKLIHYSKLKDNKKQYCDEKDQDEIISLAWRIYADRGVLQPLIIRKADTDEYEIIAGHKRRRACRYLVEEEGEKTFEFLPCIIKNLSDVRAEFQLYSSNGFHEKTDYEIMHELENMKRLLEDHPEEFPNLPSGRMVEKLAHQLHMKKSTVGEYLTISKNLGEKAKEAFKVGTLKKSAAVSMASLSHDEQDKLLDAGVKDLKDIKTYKEEMVEKRVHRTTVTDTVKTVRTNNIEEPAQQESKAVVQQADTVDVLPGQYKLVNTDMEMDEESDFVDVPVENSDANKFISMIHEIEALAGIENRALLIGSSGESRVDHYVKLSEVLDIIMRYR